jgi:hypothetical protein
MKYRVHLRLRIDRWEIHGAGKSSRVSHDQHAALFSKCPTRPMGQQDLPELVEHTQGTVQ